MGLGTIRPQIFTYLFFLVQLLVLNTGSMKREHWLWVLPILFAGWVNLHGGVLAGIGVLALWIAVRIVTRLKDDATPPIKRLTAVGQLGLIATACGLGIAIFALIFFNFFNARVARLQFELESTSNNVILMLNSLRNRNTVATDHDAHQPQQFAGTN
jgi:hypothetical protein